MQELNQIKGSCLSSKQCDNELYAFFSLINHIFLIKIYFLFILIIFKQKIFKIFIKIKNTYLYNKLRLYLY